jgi:hypothetical protein
VADRVRKNEKLSNIVQTVVAVLIGGFLAFLIVTIPRIQF